MHTSQLIFDADRHVMEPIALWKQYLPRRWRGHAPYYAYYDHGEGRSLAQRIAVGGPDGDVLLPPDLMLDGEPVLRGWSFAARKAQAISAARRSRSLLAAQDPAAQLETLDRDGLQAALLLPTYAMYLTSIDSMAPDLACAFAGAYNNWLRDYCVHAPQRLIGAALMARHDPRWMLDELERIRAFGWSSVVLRPNPVAGRLLSDPDYEPFWRACEHAQIAVVVHEGSHTRLPSAGAERFQSRFAQHACSHPMEQMMALLALIEGGVLERYPELNFIFAEAGCTWVPYWLWRLDEVEYKHLGAEVAANVTMKPSHYFRRQCFVTIEPDEPQLAQTIQWLGRDRVLFGSDFPHLDHADSVAAELTQLTRTLSREALTALFWDNPRNANLIPTANER